MNANRVVNVLTDDQWLYAGISALLKGMFCIKTGFMSTPISVPKESDQRMIILVDARIFFRGEWTAYKILRALWPDALVVWLTRDETGRFFPRGTKGDIILPQKSKIEDFTYTLKNICKHAKPSKQSERVEYSSFSRPEKKLLSYLISGVSMDAISRRSGNSIKTIYSHRLSIMNKIGFRHAAIFLFVCINNEFVTSGFL